MKFKKSTLSLLLSSLLIIGSLSACQDKDATKSNSNQPATQMASGVSGVNINDFKIAMSLEDISNIQKKLNVTDKKLDVKDVKEILSVVPINEEVKIFIEKANLPTTLTEDERYLAERLLAITYYENQNLAQLAANDLLKQEENRIKTETDILFNASKDLKGKYNIANTELEKEVLKNIETKMKEAKKTVEMTDLKINKVQQLLPQYELFIVFVNDVPVPMVTNKTADYYIVQNPDTLRFRLNGLLDEKGQKVLFNTEKEKEIYKDIVSKLNPKIKRVYGNGERKIYVFSDPNCPYCKAQDEAIDKSFTKDDNVTIYQVMNPIEELHPDAFKKAMHLFCLANPSEEWLNMQKTGVLNKFTSNGYSPDNYPKGSNITECANQVSNEKTIATMLGFHTTPVTIIDNGIVLLNQQTPEVLREALKGNAPKQEIQNEIPNNQKASEIK